MKANYVTILDFSVGEVIRIKLTDKQILESEKYDNFDDFLETLEDQYGFRLKDCQWMITDTYCEKRFGF